ncbi:MAG: UPF0104 family protein [Chloroflexota bacterium]|nr:MAG: UPF0104 family protein [Chloroflexota bacterium]
MRKFILAVVLLLGVVFIMYRLAEVQAIVETLERGDWRFLLIAFFLVLIWTINLAALFKSVYQAIGLEEKISTLLPVVLAAYFVNVVAPAGGMSGMAVFVAEAKRRNYSPGRAAIGGALYLLFDYSAFLCILAVGLFVLFRRNNLNTGEIIASALLVGIFLVLALLVYLGMRSARELGRALAWMAYIVNRILRPFLHREYLSEQRAHEFAQEAAGGLNELLKQPEKLMTPAVLAVTKQSLMILVLWMSFLAFDVPVSAGTLIAGYSIGYLFLIISPTPSGMGVVEGILTLALSSMYIPLGAAAVITIAYRGFSFWMPLLMGIAAFRWLGGSKDIRATA